MNKIPFCKPYVGKEEVEAASKSIESGWITSGGVTNEIEAEIAEYTGAKYCVLVTSCTAALHLCLEYLKKFKYGKNFTAYIPSLTFAATATEVVHAGGQIVWGDVEGFTLKKESKYGFDVAIPVHLTGVKANTDFGEADVIEDSAHLIYKDQCKDNKNFVCYSFYATKNITMGEGGAICTNNEHAYNWFKQARHHGISKGGWDRYAEGGAWRYDIDFIGWKYNPSDVLASMLKANFAKRDEIQRERQWAVDFYNEQLGYNNKGVHLYPVMVKDRDRFIKLMAEAGIQCSVHFLPLHQMTAFRHIPTKQNNLKNTEYLGERLVSLPLYPGLTNEELNHVCQTAKSTNLLISDASLLGTKVS